MPVAGLGLSTHELAGDLTDLEILVTAVATASLRQAAVASGCSQDAVVARLRALERRLGVPIIQSVEPRLRVTTGGRRHARRAEWLFRQLRTELQPCSTDLAAAPVRLGLGPGGNALDVNSLLDRFARVCPEIDVEAVPPPPEPTLASDELTLGNLDLLVQPDWARSSGCTVRGYRRGELVAVGSPTQIRRAAAGQALTWVVDATSGWGLPPGMSSSAGRCGRCVITADSHQTARALVVAGRGVALLDKLSAAPFLDAHDLQELPGFGVRPVSWLLLMGELPHPSCLELARFLTGPELAVPWRFQRAPSARITA